MPHDIIDNRDAKLADEIRSILESTESARFAVGYFFLSGMEAIQDKLAGVQRIRLLIGNTTNRETLEQIAEGYRRLEPVAAGQEQERYLKGSEQRARVAGTIENIRDTVERMDQTDQSDQLVKTLVRLIEQKRLEVRVYTRGRLHAKAYIFDYEPGHYEPGIAVVGSSNLTLAGLTHNSELNVVVHGAENHARLGQWFDELWAESLEFEEHLLRELRLCWAAAPATPYDVYMKSLLTLVGDRLDDGPGREILWDDEITRSLADFQKVAVRQAIQMIRDHGGAFVSDVVGLGKSYIGAAILKHFERIERAHPLIICPKSLEEMWESYNALYQLNAQILPMSRLALDGVLEDPRYRDRDFVLIDESHNFRHHSSQRYEALQTYLSRGGRKVCLITATPRNKSAVDVYNQIKLFHPDDITQLPIDPPNLKEYFKQVEQGGKRLQDLLMHILIRRTRRHILRYYGIAEDTDKPMRELSDGEARPYLDGRKRAYVIVNDRHQFFPRRELETLRYSIEETYAGLYDSLRQRLGGPTGGQAKPRPGKELTYARYGLWNYLLPDRRRAAQYRDLHRAGVNLRGLVRVMLFKRFESSVYAFRETLRRLERIHDLFVKSLDAGFVPAGDDAQSLLYESDSMEETELLDALRLASRKYPLADFDSARLRSDLEADQKLIQEMIAMVAPIGPGQDAKLQVLLAKLKAGIPQKTGKVLLFTQYADTARYLHENLNPGGRHADVDCVYGTDKSKSRTAARFAPQANPQTRVSPGEEIRILVATDVMSEGLNLQDGDVVVNYDLHWNPVRLIQRFGRIDRIGSQNDVIWGFNFLPETALERQLGLKRVLEERIQEIHNTIGEDAAILDSSEQVNEQAMFAIYEGKTEHLAEMEDEEGDYIDLNEAEEILRSLRQDDPEEFKRISELRDGIRSARGVLSGRGRYVMCQAGLYRQLYLMDTDGALVTRDLSRVLARLRCPADEPTAQLPGGHNAGVMAVLGNFAAEVKHRRAEQRHSLSLTVAQVYVTRELRALLANLGDDEEMKRQVSVLDDAFRRPVSMAVRRQLNVVRRNGVTGRALAQLLTELYHEHGLGNTANDRTWAVEASEMPRVVCSEALV